MKRSYRMFNSRSLVSFVTVSWTRFWSYVWAPNSRTWSLDMMRGNSLTSMARFLRRSTSSRRTDRIQRSTTLPTTSMTCSTKNLIIPDCTGDLMLSMLRCEVYVAETLALSRHARIKAKLHSSQVKLHTSLHNYLTTELASGSITKGRARELSRACIKRLSVVPLLSWECFAVAECLRVPTRQRWEETIELGSSTSMDAMRLQWNR